MTFEDWLTMGVINKWCSPPVCEMHDGPPVTEEEENDLESGFDPCFTVVRLFGDESEYDSARRNNELVWINYIPKD